MRKALLAIAALVAFCAGSANAWDINCTASDGAVVEITGKKGERIAVGDGSFVNTDSGTRHVIEFAGSGTLKIKGTESNPTMYANIVATNGNFTIDLTGLADPSKFLFGGGILCDDYTLVVKGADKLRYGSKFVIFAGGYAYRAPNVEFQAADGTPNPNGTVEFVDYAIVACAPLRWTTAPGFKIMALAGDDALHLEGQQSYSWQGYHLVSYLASAIPSTTTINVGQNATFSFLPCTVKNTGGGDGDSHRFYGFWRANGAIENEIVLSDSTSTLLTGSLDHKTTYSGAIRGNGTILHQRARENVKVDPGVYTVGISDLDGFTGKIKACEIDKSEPRVTLQFACPLPAAFGGIEISEDAYVRFSSGATMAEDAEGVDIKVATGKIVVDDGVTVVAKTLDFTGDLKVDAAPTGKLIVRSETHSGAYSIRTYGSGLFSMPTEALPAFDATFEREGARISAYANGKTYWNIGEMLDDDASGTWDLVPANSAIRYSCVPPTVRIVPGSATMSVTLPPRSEMNSVELDGGTIRVDQKTDTWKQDAYLWLDGSRLDTFREMTTNGVAAAGWADGAWRKLIDRWNDCRSWQTERYMLNNRINEGDLGFWPQVYPFIDESGLNGKPFVSMRGGKRRIELSSAPFNARFIVSVVRIDSDSSGSCKGLFGDRYGAFARSGESADDCIMTNRNFVTWVDGVKTNGWEAKFKAPGEWQIVTVAVTNRPTNLSGLCYARAPATESGYASYAEVVIFDKIPTDDEHANLERHLAEKWGLEYNRPYEAAKLNLNGNGTATIAESIELSGAFSGTLDLESNAYLTFGEDFVPDNVTVTGSGCVTLDGLANAPQIDPAFSGVLEIASGTIEFAAASPGIANPIAIQGKVKAPAACTVTVNGKPGAGKHVLIDCAGGLSATEWTLAGVPENWTLIVEDGRLVLNVPKGLVVILR